MEVERGDCGGPTWGLGGLLSLVCVCAIRDARWLLCGSRARWALCLALQSHLAILCALLVVRLQHPPLPSQRLLDTPAAGRTTRKRRATCLRSLHREQDGERAGTLLGATLPQVKQESR